MRLPSFLHIDLEDPSSQTVIRTIQYAVLSVLVVAGAALLVLAGQGYDFNRSTGEVIQNGLLLVNTAPEDATVSIDGVSERDSTPGRFALPAGDYDVRITKDGYRQWDKRVAINGSGVEWVYYPLLIPSALTTQQVAAFKAIEFIEQSGDGQRIVYRQKSQNLSLTSARLGATSVDGEETITLDKELLRTPDAKLGAISFEGWAGNNRHLLIQYMPTDAATEYLLVDTDDPDESRNITLEFDLDLQDVRFIDGGVNNLYALVDGDLRRLDLANNTVTAPIARSVSRYVLYQDRFVVYASGDKNISTIYMIEGNGEPKAIAQYDVSPAKLRFEFAEFDEDFHLAVLNTETGIATIVTNPQQQTSIAPLEQRISLKGAQFLSFSRNGQFIAVQGGGSFVVYDFDRERNHEFSLPFTVARSYESIWMDAYRFIAHDEKNIIHMIEFDGGNLQKLIATDPQFDVFFSNGLASMVSVGVKAESGTQFLEKTALLIEN